jgi:hypothetical protein
MVGVFPNSSLETPASEDVGIAVQRHGWSCIRWEVKVLVEEHGSECWVGCAHQL